MSGAGLTLSGAIAVRVVWAAVHVVRARRAERLRQRTLVGLCGRYAPDLHAVVLDAPHPAVYCLAGRENVVILTSATIGLLTRLELAAVLAHEQAHLRARHHRLLATATWVGSTLPEIPLMRHVVRQVRRLLEMHADDLAAGVHDPETLATALVAVATARSAVAGIASVGLAAADSDTAVRIRRLLLPPATLSRRRRRTVRAGVAGFAMMPLLVAATPAAVAANQPRIRQAAAVRQAAAIQHVAAATVVKHVPAALSGLPAPYGSERKGQSSRGH